MSSNSLFMDLFMPLQTEVERIFNTIQELKHQKVEGTPFIKTGAFNAEYSAFRSEMKRRGGDFSVNSFYNSLLKELDTYEKEVIRLEKKLLEEGNPVQTHQLIPRILEVRDHILELQPSIRVVKKSPPVKKPIVTYKWLKESKMKEKFRKAVSTTFLGIKPRATDFESVFFDRVEVKDDFKPLTWNSDNASELKLFCEELIDNGIVEAPSDKYRTLAACFVRPDGTSFDNIFKNLKVGPDSNIGRHTREKVKDLIEKFN